MNSAVLQICDRVSFSFQVNIINIIIPRMDTVEWFLWQSTILRSVVTCNSFSTQKVFLLLLLVSIYFLRRSFFGEFLYLHVFGCVYVCCKHNNCCKMPVFEYWPFETGNLFRATFHIFGMLWMMLKSFGPIDQTSYSDTYTYIHSRNPPSLQLKSQEYSRVKMKATHNVF